MSSPTIGMSRSQLAFIRACICLLTLRGAAGLQFTMLQYTARVSGTTSRGTVIQQVVALSSDSSATVTYGVHTNPHVQVDRLSGEVVWKNSSITAVMGSVYNYTVMASISERENTTSILQLEMTKHICSCAHYGINSINVSIAENETPHSLVYLQDSSCGPDSGYQLNGSKLMSLESGRLAVGKLDFENTEFKKAEAVLVCSEDKHQVKVTVHATDQPDQSPFMFYNRERTSFLVKNYNIDADQHTPFLPGGTYTLSVFADALGSADRYNISTLNNRHSQLNAHIETVSPILFQGVPTNYIYIVVTAANTTRISSSTNIDVIFTDNNMERQESGNDSVSNTVTMRFRLTYTDENALQKLTLEEEYELKISNNSPAFTPVLRVLNETSKFLTFELEPLSSAQQSCAALLAVTGHQGVIYVNDSVQIAACANRPPSYNMTVAQSGSKTRYALLRILVLPEDELVANTTSLVSCSNYKHESDCESNSGIGSLRCQWKVLFNYSTCVPSETCADDNCSEYEMLDKAICPQDCLGGNTWYNTASGYTCRSPVGLCDGQTGVCYCDDSYYCVCTPEHMLYIPYTTQSVSDFTDSINGMCGLQCTIIIAVALAVSTLTIVLTVLWCRRKKTKLAANINDWRVNGNHLDFNFTTVSDYDENTPSTIISAFNHWPQAHPYLNTGNMEVYDEKWELSRDKLIIGDFIGEGEFGKVLKAQYQKCLLSEWVPVAVKMLKDGASRVEFADLLSEYTLLKEVDHPNIIKLIGASTLNGPFHLVVEYCEHGSLKNYLRGVRTQQPIYVNGGPQFYTEHATQLMDFCCQISNGMQYLSEIKLVHRDLATRNILIASDMVIKISDFGMTKDIYEEDAYKKKGQGRIPVKWMAPESLYHQIYTTKSDVWSYGITLWEIATLGATPYPGIPAERMYNMLQEGYRMDRPETCSIPLYTLMKKCWDYDPGTRPSFKELRHCLKKMISGSDSCLDLTVVAKSQQLCHGSSSTSTGSEDGSETHQLTVALLPTSDSKFVADYLVSSTDARLCDEKSPLRYTTLEFTDDD